MTDGLKLAAGNALRDILAHWTATPMRGIAAGVLITAAVQSSGAVIFATLGFVNAGLLTLTQAIGVILGSSIGSTTTSWLVALIGFKLDLRLLALPAIALGTLLRITGGNSRRAPIGDAIIGFGVFFIGIDVLKSSFDASAIQLPLDQFGTADLSNLLLFVLIGIVLTALMQSSGASLALTLTAVAGGMIPVSLGAAVVIGANVGTTSTSIIAMLNATADTKRAALGYVIFKVTLALFSLLMLSPLLWLVGLISHWLRLGDSPALLLAIFHTLINVIGVALMRPLIEPLARFLASRFRTQEEDESRPRHLDHNVAATPAMALEALKLELARIGAIAHRAAAAALNGQATDGRTVRQDRETVRTLMLAVGEFVNQVQRQELTQDVVDALPLALRIGRHYDGMVLNAKQLLQNRPAPVLDPLLAGQLQEFREAANRLLALDAGYQPEEAAQLLAEWDERYKTIKAALLQAGSDRRLPIAQMVACLDEAAAMRRMVRQAINAAAYSQRLGAAIALVAPEPTAAAADEEAQDLATEVDLEPDNPIRALPPPQTQSS